MSDVKCYRCGKCCHGFLGIVPKYETSDLSPEFLQSMSFDEFVSYCDANGELMGDPCKWLNMMRVVLQSALFTTKGVPIAEIIQIMNILDIAG